MNRTNEEIKNNIGVKSITKKYSMILKYVINGSIKTPEKIKFINKQENIIYDIDFILEIDKSWSDGDCYRDHTIKKIMKNNEEINFKGLSFDEQRNIKEMTKIGLIIKYSNDLLYLNDFNL